MDVMNTSGAGIRDPYETLGTVEAMVDGVARVRMDRPARCGSCYACATTEGAGIVAEMEAIPGLEPGDRVQIALDPSGIWRGTLWTFVLPLVALIGGAVAGWHVKGLQRAVGLSADLTAGLCGLMLMAAAFGLGILRNRRLERDPACQPRIVRKL